ncbi:hypothetical protein PCANB_001622 [Pneumocystis canis]|nr:hypothetical protein PCANB_001622 [Pneumocystis canis]
MVETPAPAPAPNDLGRVWKLIETLTEQLTINQEAIAVLKRQINILKDQLILIMPKTSTEQKVTDISLTNDTTLTQAYAQLIQEHQTLKHENYALNTLLDAYENGIQEILLKIRAFIHDTTNQTLQLHKHYREQLLNQQEQQQRQQKSYLDLQAGLYRINVLIQQAYMAHTFNESEIKELQIENPEL